MARQTRLACTMIPHGQTTLVSCHVQLILITTVNVHLLCFVLMYLYVITYCDIREMLFADKRKNIFMTTAKCIR